MLWVGVDIGGTFTDVIVYDAQSRVLRAAKSLSTPAEPVRAVLDGLAKLKVGLAEVTRFVHGTTRVTNALLEHAGLPIALITTDGFRDVVEMGRGYRNTLYSVKELPSPKLVARDLRFEVPERMTVDGSVLRALDESALADVLDRIAERDVAGVAVCFLHAYRNPAHELRAAEMVRERFPALACSTSAEVVPEIGEYERFATTALNVSVQPIVDDYLKRLESALKAAGYKGDLSIMTSSGGVVTAGQARRLPMQLALSGPAGGVAASIYAAVAAGMPNVITCDMGGTSTDVCLIKDGRAAMTSQGVIGGFPNKTFQVEIETIGAGGGSIAWKDVGGELCIGPQSAGSTPGPACYGRGGKQPTTTDAHLVVGHLDVDEPLGGEVRLDVEAARRACAELGASIGGLSAEQLAIGIIQLAIVKMTSAIKEITVARGHDPRDFVLLPFGGAGPMHATALADELGIRTVLIPPVPGNLSALGFVTSRARHDLVRTMLRVLDGGALPVIAAAFEALQAEALTRLRAGGLSDEATATFQWSVGIRIHGQSFELQVPVEESPRDAEVLAARFREVYQARYAYLPGSAQLEVVNCRLTALGPSPDVNLSSAESHEPPTAASTRIYTRGGWAQAQVRQRASLADGESVPGPLIVRESGATTVVGAGWSAARDTLGNLIVSRN